MTEFLTLRELLESKGFTAGDTSMANSSEILSPEVMALRSTVMAGTGKSIGQHLDEFDSWRDPDGRTFDEVMEANIAASINDTLFEEPGQSALPGSAAPAMEIDTVSYLQPTYSGLPDSTQVAPRAQAPHLGLPPSLQVLINDMYSPVVKHPGKRSSTATSMSPSPLSKDAMDAGEDEEM